MSLTTALPSDTDVSRENTLLVVWEEKKENLHWKTEGHTSRIIGLNAIVCLLAREFEESYRVAHVVGGTVAARFSQSTVGTSEVP